jgi:hypothetical protein
MGCKNHLFQLVIWISLAPPPALLSDEAHGLAMGSSAFLAVHKEGKILRSCDDSAARFGSSQNEVSINAWGYPIDAGPLDGLYWQILDWMDLDGFGESPILGNLHGISSQKYLL